MKRILIVGAGIAGLMMKNRLEALGYASILCEQNETLRAEGAGLLLGANVVKIFKDIGLDSELLLKSQVVNTIETQDKDGGLLGKLDLKKVYNDTGYQTLTIYREALFNILSNSIDRESLWLSHKLIAIEKLTDGYKVSSEMEKLKSFLKSSRPMDSTQELKNSPLWMMS